MDISKVISVVEEMGEHFLIEEDRYSVETAQAFDQAMAILRRQEPVRTQTVYSRTGSWEVCPECQTLAIRSYNYCPKCGRAMKFEGKDAEKKN